MRNSFSEVGTIRDLHEVNTEQENRCGSKFALLSVFFFLFVCLFVCFLISNGLSLLEEYSDELDRRYGFDANFKI